MDNEFAEVALFMVILIMGCELIAFILINMP
jgi:hypothetical protein